MIQCEKCGNWQHTPCVGYCSNRDKRIPKEGYICYICRFGTGNMRVVQFLKDLSCFRRVVAVLYTDGFKSISELSRRLSCTIKKASFYVKKLEEEELLKRTISGTTVTFQPCTGTAVKEKLNFYFGPDPEKMKNFPKLTTSTKGGKREAPVIPNPTIINPNKRRKSQTSIPIDA